MRIFLSVAGAAAVAASAVTIVTVAGASTSSAVPVVARQPAMAAAAAFGVASASLVAPRDPRVQVIRTPAQRPTKRPAAARPVVRHTATAKPHVHKASRHATKRTPSGPTSWGALNAAIARIPTYVPGAAHWVVKDTGWWGTADWDASIIYISPAVPESKLYDVAVHEWSHILSVRDYGGDVARAVNAMQLYFSGKVSATDLMPAEIAADCMAIVQGADWTDYTSCSSAHWRAGAEALVAGHRLPGISL